MTISLNLLKPLKILSPVLKSFFTGRGIMYVLFVIIGLITWQLKGLIDNQKYSTLNNEYTNYKLNVSESVNAENQAVISKLSGLIDSLKSLDKDFQKKAAADEEFHNSVKKELYEANGKSCPLSPAVEHYLDRLRDNQQSRRTN